MERPASNRETQCHAHAGTPGHEHHHGHSHHEHHAAGHDPGEGRGLSWALALTGGFAVVELIGGVVAGSLTLIADAGHMFADSAALALAWVALRFAGLPSDRRRTYGYQRLQVLAAFVNSLVLLVGVCWLAYEAIMRFQEPAPIAGPLMLTIAIGGLLVNLIALKFLHRGGGHHEHSNLNLRAAYLHVLTDSLGSVMAITAAVVVMLTGWTRIDPLLSLFVAILIVTSGVRLLKQSTHILLEGSPEWLDPEELQRELKSAVAGVTDVHHVHIWSLTSNKPLLTLHANLRPEASPAAVLVEIKRFLAHRYGIDHSTIQLEAADCADHHSAT